MQQTSAKPRTPHLRPVRSRLIKTGIAALLLAIVALFQTGGRAAGADKDIDMTAIDSAIPKVTSPLVGSGSFTPNGRSNKPSGSNDDSNIFSPSVTSNSNATQPTPPNEDFSSESPENVLTLGNYPNSSIELSGNTTVTPDAAPTNTTSINVSTSTDFKGRLEGDSATGVVRITDAHPAGIYTVTVRAFNSLGQAVTKTFTLTVTTPPTCNPLSFAPAVNFAVGNNPTAEAIGDFNRDGNQDIAVANGYSNSVTILLGNGGGAFGTATNFFGNFQYPTSVAVGDFNNDGKQDLAVTDDFSISKVSILLGDGNGAFGTPTDFEVGPNPRSLAVGDFNGDGKQDLAVAYVSAGYMSIFLGNGAGGFGTTINVPADANNVAVGDFNGDAKQDLAVTSTNGIGVFPGDGVGGFATPLSLDLGTYPSSLVIGDLNNDGKQDLAVASYAPNVMSILLGNGVGGFSRSTDIDAGTRPESVVVGDFNGDGKQDVVVSNYTADFVSIFLGNGVGVFGSAVRFGTGSVPGAVVIGDFNADGKQDLAVANRQSANVSILLRTCPVSPTPTGTPTLTPTASPTYTPTSMPTPCNPAGLDITFNGTGKVTTPIGSSNDSGRSVAIQTDGKIVVAGESLGSNYDFAIVRYNTDGTLDTSFNGTGKVTTPIGSANDYAYSVAIQADGKIVAAGYSHNGSNNDFAVVRYNADGTLDTSFNGTGKVTTPVGSDNDQGYGVAIQSNGKIVVAGESYDGSNNTFAVVRYNIDGSLDTSFNGSGKVTTSGISSARSVTIQIDGRIVVAGGLVRFQLARYNPDGTLDTSFNGTGIVTTLVGGQDSQDGAYSVAIQSDGKIVSAGYSGQTIYRFAVVRYNSTGTLDSTFSGDGKVTTDVGFNGGIARSVAIQSDGKVVAAGQSTNQFFSRDFTLIRYSSDGALDTSFNGTGIAITPVISGSGGTAASVAIQIDQKIVAAGQANSDFAVVRYYGTPVTCPTPVPTCTPFAEEFDVISNLTSAGWSLQNKSQPVGITNWFQGNPNTFRTRLFFDPPNSYISANYKNGAGMATINNWLVTPTLTLRNGSTLSFYTRTVNTPAFADRLQVRMSTSGSSANVGGVTATEPDVGDFTSLLLDINPNYSLSGYPSDWAQFTVTVSGLTSETTGRFGFRYFVENGGPSGTNSDTIGIDTFVYNLNCSTPTATPTGSVSSTPTSTPTLTATATATATPPQFQPASFDYDGDGKTDVSVFRPSTSIWYIQTSQTGDIFQVEDPGSIANRIAPANYYGQGKTNIASYSPSTGIWSARSSISDGTIISLGLANPNPLEDLRAPADGDGDGRADAPVFRPSQGSTVRQNTGNRTDVVISIPFAQNADIPTIGDFDGDGRADSVVFRRSSGTWNGVNSFGTPLPTPFPVQLGDATDVAVPGDYDGDGKTDVAVYRPVTAIWYVRGSLSGGPALSTYPFGRPASRDVPCPGDYDGDGKTDLCYFSPDAAANVDNWHVRNSSTGSTVTYRLGTDGDIPTPSAFLYFPTAIAGTVTYGNALGSPPPPRFVSNVMMSGAGSVPVSVLTTAGGGEYLLSGFGSGSYTVTPSKTGGASNITSFDAAKISQHVAGPPLPQLTGNQLIVADVSGNGSINSFDAGQVAKYAAGPPFVTPGVGLTGSWKFSPVSRNYASVTSYVGGEDYSALLMGEVSGNWANTGARPAGISRQVAAGGTERGISVDLPGLRAKTRKEIIVPVSVHGLVGKEVISYEFDLRYDPSVIQPQAEPVELAGTVSRGLSAVANTSTPGLLRIVVYGPMPINCDGVLLNLRFKAVGVVGSVSPLVFEQLLFNEGEPSVGAVDGQVELISNKQ